MYEEYFGLSAAPFKLNPDPRFFFGSRSHNKAMAYLHYGLKQAEGFIVITGAVGAGKSMIIGHLLDQMNSSNVVAAQLLTSNIEPDELLGQILSAFRVEPEGEGRTGQLEAFEDYLFDQLNRGRRALLIVDEAQNLPHRTLEELRMLSNIDYDGTPLFQAFLIGQPEFREMLESEKLEQLKQRVIASYHLESLTAEESREYILHRLSVVGWKDDPAFADDAFAAIHEETGGRPRRINTLADRLMLYCALEKQHEVTGDIVGVVLGELLKENLGGEKQGAPESKNKLSGRKRNERIEAPASGGVRSGGVKEMDKAETAGSVVVAPSGSVLDRVHARRDIRHDLRPGDAPGSATLGDIASAIAAASAGGPDMDAALADDEEGLRERAVEKKKTLANAVNETRDELKQAHATVRKLHQTLMAEARQREKKREKAVASLSRAETLLAEIRSAMR